VNLDECLPSLIAASIPNSGQICFATTRILAPRSRYDEVVSRLSEAVGALQVGNPHEPGVVVGPLAARRQRDRVEHYVTSGIEAGARIVIGGGRPAGIPKGWFVEPTVFADVDNSMAIAQDEIFGPVLTVIQYDTEDDAVQFANDSDYGLGGAVYAGDLSRAVAGATRIRTGTCAVNGAPPGGGGGPFSGYKRSGLGREGGIEGQWAYLETKTVTLPPGAPSHSATLGLLAPSAEQAD
jgi:aldehyde dehydrogenase (NAD+)